MQQAKTETTTLITVYRKDADILEERFGRPVREGVRQLLENTKPPRQDGKGRRPQTTAIKQPDCPHSDLARQFSGLARLLETSDITPVTIFVCKGCGTILVKQKQPVGV